MKDLCSIFRIFSDSINISKFKNDKNKFTLFRKIRNDLQKYIYKVTVIILEN